MFKLHDVVINGNKTGRIVKVTELWDDNPEKRIQYWVVFDVQLDDDPYKFYWWELRYA